MLKFAICDDEKEYLHTSKNLLEEYAAQKEEIMEVYCFPNTSYLLDSVESGAEYDAYILDIYMPGVTGISLAAHLRSININSPIVFLTSSAEHAVEAFGVNATHYLLKPYSSEQFFAAIDKVLAQLSVARPKDILLKVEDGYHSISPKEILYCESDGNYQRVYLKNGEALRVRITSLGLYDLLKGYEYFCQCGRSYILNLSHIKKIAANTAVLKNDKIIAVPRAAMHNLRKAYFDYFDRYL